MKDLEKDVLLKDCFSVDELQSIESFLPLMSHFYLMSGFLPEYVEEKVERLDRLRNAVLASIVYLMD